MHSRAARGTDSRRFASIHLDRGRRVSIRPIDSFDRPALSAFYASLSDESRRRRFLGWHHLTSSEIEATANGIGLVAVLRTAGPDDGAIVAHAQLCPDGTGSLEAGFAVRDDVQGRGIGSALVRGCLDVARDLSLRRLVATTYPDNLPMRRLLLGAGCAIESYRIDAGIEEIVLRIPAVGPAARPAVAPVA